MALSWMSRMLKELSRPVSRSGRRQSHRPRPARLQVEALEDRQLLTVSFFGGNLLPQVQAQALFLGNEFSTAPANSEPAALDAFLKDITGGPYMQALTRAGYNVGVGSAVAGAIDRTSLTAGSTISDAFIRSRLQADVNSGLLQAPNANTLYVVYVEPDVAVNLGAGQGTTQQGILGYHTAFLGANGAPIRYAVVVSPGGAAGNSVLPEATSAMDQQTAVTSHELAEAVTDPDVNSNVNNGRLGWVDLQRGQEIGDITENNPNAFVRLDGHLVQEVADQNDQLLQVNPAATVTQPSDPGFETPNVAAAGFQVDPTGSPWTFAGAAGLASNGGPVTSGNPNAPQGTQVAWMQNGGTVSQVVNVAAGSYTISFEAAQRGNFPSHSTIQVKIDGQTVGTITPTGTSYALYSTGPFTVTAGSHTIQFVGVGVGGSTALFDAVSIAAG